MNDNNLASWSESVQSGVGEAMRKVIVGIPDILAAIVVLLIGVVVASVLKALVIKLLTAVNLKGVTDRVGLNQVFQGKFALSELIGDLVKWFFIIVFLLQALTIAHLQQVNNLVEKVLGYVPNVLVAAALVFIGAVVADLASRVIRDAARAMSASTSRVLADGAKYTILAVVAFTALDQLGVSTLFLDRLFTAIVVMLALAGGLAFGLGGRDAAKDILDSLRNSFKSEE
jgi:hypothetical protein